MEPLSQNAQDHLSQLGALTMVRNSRSGILSCTGRPKIGLSGVLAILTKAETPLVIRTAVSLCLTGIFCAQMSPNFRLLCVLTWRRFCSLHLRMNWRATPWRQASGRAKRQLLCLVSYV